jgi:TolA-binding protein
MLSPEMKDLGDQVVAAVKQRIAHDLAPLLQAQQELLARVDKQAQRISALNKEVADLQRKLTNQER